MRGAAEIERSRIPGRERCIGFLGGNEKTETRYWNENVFRERELILHK